MRTESELKVVNFGCESDRLSRLRDHEPGRHVETTLHCSLLRIFRGGGANLQSRFVVDGTGTERRVVGVAVEGAGDRPVEIHVREWIRASEYRTNKLDQSSGRENCRKGGETTMNLVS